MGKVLHIGLLSTYLVLEVATDSTGSMGSPKKTWATEANIWADLRHSPTQRESYQADQKVALDKAEAVIYNRTINPGQHRLNNNGQIYDILGVMPVEDREAVPGKPLFIKLILEKKDNTGG